MCVICVCVWVGGVHTWYSAYVRRDVCVCVSVKVCVSVEMCVSVKVCQVGS